MIKFKIIMLSLCLFSSILQAKLIPVVADKLNVRAKPSLKSKVVIQIKNANLVEILKRSNKITTINGKRGRWVYIDTQFYATSQDVTDKGWVFDYYLGYRYRFKRVYKWPKRKIHILYGDAWIDLKIYPNGYFTAVNGYVHASKVTKKYDKGYMYRCRNVFAFRNFSGNDLFYMFLGKDRKLKSWYSPE